MKQTPILFKTEMVQAILDGRKTQTRRILKRQPDIDPQTGDWLYKGIEGSEEVIPINEWVNAKQGSCPFGKPGDLLWVKETFSQYRDFAEDTKDENPFIYKADVDNCGQYPCILNGEEVYVNKRNHWKPSLFMPKSAARLWLEIVSVRLERLKHISESDAFNEGVRYINGAYASPGHGLCQSRFKDLWESINGPDSWEENPFVWVVEFKRIKNPNE